ncbi:MAG TPA: AAA family ATPase [Solirubrobacteraceae bacterium]|jgi:DNA-binding CsgD family transcriptional regulator|nr:AAA family ATPase [Solirubrobacteraceae bacterium]
MTGIASQKRSVREPSRLIERGWELHTLQQSLAAAQSGAGSVVYVEGAAGAGRTALLQAAAGLARGGDLEILTATGVELERAFPFGVVLQLLEPIWLRADPRDREALVLGPAAPAAELLGQAHVDNARSSPDPPYRLIHALYWFVRNLVSRAPAHPEPTPVVMIVDDVHWADAESARFLAYLAQRIGPLPALVVVSATGAGRPEPEALAALRRSSQTAVLTPAPLTPGGVAVAARRRYPEAGEEFCRAVADATGGNPVLLQALLAHAIEHEISPADPALIANLLPDAVVDAVRRRLDALSAVHRAVATGAAILGADASLRNLAAFAAIDHSTVSRIADELVATGLLRAQVPVLYVQPLVRLAALATLPAAERARAHGRAAELLSASGADPIRIAPHLAVAAPGAETVPLGVLRDCASAALAADDPRLAIALLERALLEQPAADVRAELLMELGLAEVEAGLPAADRHLLESKRLTRDPRRHAEIALVEAERLYANGDYRAAAEILESGIDQLNSGDPDLKRHLRVAYVAAASLVPGLAGRALEQRDGILTDSVDPLSAAERVALAHTVALDGLRGVPNQKLRERALLAWSGGALLESAACSEDTLPMLLTSLVLADELDLLDELAGELACGDAAAGRVRDLRPLRSWSLYLRGQVAEAEAEASVDLDAVRRVTPRAVALAVTACCQIHRGVLEAADAALTALGELAAGDATLVSLHHLIASEVRLAQHRPDDALEHASAAAAALQSVFPEADRSAIPWRSAAAAAHLALGQADQARPLLEAELNDARRTGNVRVTIRSLRLLGLAVGGAPGLALLRDAVEIGDGVSPRLEHLRALVDYGAALRRANQRAAARAPLSRALELSHQAGAAGLAERARTELVAAGARPRRLALSGIESLTTSQRRVAELAARGLTTRQVAEALFVTPKTVEFHLRQAYRKLDVGSRSELTKLFRG